MPSTKTFAAQNAAKESSPLDCDVTSFAMSRFSYDDVNALRKQSDTLPGALGNSVLRHSDEQTLTALVAVRDAVARLENAPHDFDQWGVVFSTRYLGRSAFAQALNKFSVDGPWNVSVQVVPNRSLHSPASMVGLALGCHGPCVGVGGGLDGETDAWLTATSLLDQQSLPGIWLIFAGWEPDKRIDIEGTPLTDTNCTALALALQPSLAGPRMATLRLVYDQEAPLELEVPATQTALSQFESFMASERGNGGEMTTPLGGGLCVQMEWFPAAVATIPLPVPLPNGQRKAA